MRNVVKKLPLQKKKKYSRERWAAKTKVVIGHLFFTFFSTKVPGDKGDEETTIDFFQNPLSFVL
jgi:hypothetical protein